MQQPLSKTQKINLFKQDFYEEYKVIQEVRDKKITYCGYPKLENICKAIKHIQSKEIPGIYIECGCALGGSAIVIARMKPKSNNLYIYDVFSMIPAPSERDGIDAHNRYTDIVSGASKGLGDNKYYGYIDNLKDIVIENIESFELNLKSDNISLVEGLFEETLKIKDPVAFAHIDCDWYDSVQVCIDRIVPNMTSGAVIVFDDYSSYSGCKKAVDNLLETANFEVLICDRSMVLIKI
ncbi:hypothetical protein NIES267_04710 [Calothrix parasitica NIES-267]|uniref:Asparagine synthase n=1 Tax=Calothrix parasitica NIES-267 TaxID=1973488 RepID=A0A1Z4LIE3_9CYAN|nr:hypothetical protein NIES267_04710 [Calothrix parasitica NIES-267]